MLKHMLNLVQKFTEIWGMMLVVSLVVLVVTTVHIGHSLGIGTILVLLVLLLLLLLPHREFLSKFLGSLVLSELFCSHTDSSVPGILYGN